MRDRRVLMVSPFFPAHGGGIEVVAGRLAAAVAAAGASVCWMAGGPPHEWPPAHPAVDIVPARSLQLLGRRPGLPMPLWGPRALARLWREVGRAEVVHVHDVLYQPSLCALAFAALRRKPAVVTQHVGEIRYASRALTALLAFLNRQLVHRVLARVALVAFVGKPVQEYFTRMGAFRRQPQLIANGVDHHTYRPATRSNNSDVVRLLFVGRFVEKKGIALLRNCVDLPGARWTFIGSGPLDPRGWSSLEAPAVLDGLRAADLVPHYQGADLLVLPSTGEGFPLVVQEALACGTPVLVSAEVAQAFPQLDGRCVFQVDLDAGEPAARLREQIEALVMRRDVLAAARGPAAQLAAQWSWPTCANRYLAAYETLLRPG